MPGILQVDSGLFECRKAFVPIPGTLVDLRVDECPVVTDVVSLLGTLECWRAACLYQHWETIGGQLPWAMA